MGRKTLLFIVITVLILMCQSICALEYQPMVQEGKQWTYYYTNANYELNFHYRIDGDTIIDGEKWYKLYEDAVNQWTGDVIVRKHYVGALLEKEGRVYRIAKSRQTKELLCDFNLEVGDKTSEGNWEVADVKSIYAFGTTRKCLTLRRVNEDPYLYNAEYWIEGVGSSSMIMPATLRLMSCFEDNRCIFTIANLVDMPEAKTNPVPDQLLSDGKQWWYDLNVSVQSVDTRMVLLGDTVIADNKWKKLYVIETPGSTPVYSKALREEDGRVYELPSGGQEQLLFDFTIQVGERYYPKGREDKYLEVIAVDTMMSAGIARRRLILQQYVNNTETNLSYWTEGIGSECGIDQPALWSDMGPLYLQSHGGHDRYWLTFSACADKNGNCVYGTIPSNDTGIGKVEVNTIYESIIYDLQGRQLQGRPRKGLYIQDGKKYLVK